MAAKFFISIATIVTAAAALCSTAAPVAAPEASAKPPVITMGFEGGGGTGP